MSYRIVQWGNMRPGGSEHYVANALRLAGHEVLSVSAKVSPFSSARSLADDRMADVLLFHQISRELIPELAALPRQIVSCCWHWDLINSRYDPSRFDRACAIAESCGVFATSDGSCVRDIKGAILLREGAPDDAPPSPPKPPDHKSCDVAFVGSLYGRRTEWYRHLQQRFRDRLWWIKNAFGKTLVDMLARSLVVVAPPWPAFDHYWSDRIYRMAAYGKCLVCVDTPGLRDDGWIAGQNIVAYDGTSRNCIDVLERVIASTSLRESVGARARETVLERHTFDHRVATLTKAIASVRHARIG